MCLTCGCGEADGVRVRLVHEHDGDVHEHVHEHVREHPHRPPATTTTVPIDERVLAKNDHLAARVRAGLVAREITAVNLMSSPGAGKTSLLEWTIRERGGHGREVCVIEGDQETAFDAERIARAGARAVQVNTGAGCHLDVTMVERALAALDPAAGSLLFVENVGNLVCPALFDVGERARVVVVSVTEGDDKPLKYPHMFAAADVVVVNKTDLLPYVDFDLPRFEAQAGRLRPGVRVLPVSVRTGDRLDTWLAWLDGLATAPTPGGQRGPAVRA